MAKKYEYDHEYQAHLDFKVFGKWLWSPVFHAKNAGDARTKFFRKTFNTADQTMKNYNRIVVKKVHN
jgi:hypothetical protein